MPWILLQKSNHDIGPAETKTLEAWRQERDKRVAFQTPSGEDGTK